MVFQGKKEVLYEEEKQEKDKNPLLNNTGQHLYLSIFNDWM
jgi:hypothetical protein